MTATCRGCTCQEHRHVLPATQASTRRCEMSGCDRMATFQPVVAGESVAVCRTCLRGLMAGDLGIRGVTPAEPDVPTGGWGREGELQTAVATYLDRHIGKPGQEPRPECGWWHTPNGGRRHKREAAILRGQGVHAGVPDCQILARDLTGAIVSHWIELKLPGGTLSTAQRGFRDWCYRYGQPWAVCHSLAEVEDTLRDWGLLSDGEGSPTRRRKTEGGTMRKATEMTKRHVMVTTSHRGVFIGWTDDPDGADPMVLTDCRMAIYWGTTRGLFELASDGPTGSSKISAPVERIELRSLTAVVDLSQKASEAWQAL